MSLQTDELQNFNWRPQPQAAGIIHAQIQRFRQQCGELDEFGDRLREETGTRLCDWIDHFALPAEEDLKNQLGNAGFQSESINGKTVWRHPGALLPWFELHEESAGKLFFRVESLEDFFTARAHHAPESGKLCGPLHSAVRESLVAQQGDMQWWVIERHGSPFADAASLDMEESLEASIKRHGHAFDVRKRDFPASEQGFDKAESLIRAAIADLGTDRTCDLFFMAERAYWQTRNKAAQVQKERQDALGLGWANHDHHTYRSSRKHFFRLISLLELLGFICRERFYAGAEAGWGAQVLAQPSTGVVIFADVDLSPEEVAFDFAHQPLAENKSLGTVGLWCRLHGEAFLQAGMHHLECQFDFDAAREQLAVLGIKTMKPFTDLPHLRQAFTQGENWPVAISRIESLLQEGLVTPSQAEQFQREGALGSHLEILERCDGYQGFNQSGINEIIRDTDPRK